ncbi:MAG: type IV secretory system conjugative DNA transfer family protein [Bacteroidota bacterium]
MTTTSESSNIPALQGNKLVSWFILILAGLLGMFYSPLLIGAVLGYILGYHRLLKTRKEYPNLYPLPNGMGRYILLPAIIVGCLALMGINTWSNWLDAQYLILFYSQHKLQPNGELPQIGTDVLRTISVLTTLTTMYFFIIWRKKVMITVREKLRHGSARFATRSELAKVQTKKKGKGIYIGGGKHYYHKQGHLVTVAGTRSGKGVNLILPNLLGAANLEASWMVIDPKGENTIISAAYQKSLGKTVRILNPWRLLGLPTSTYNPLDIISDPQSDHLPDDASLLADMIVPATPGKDDHWINRARSLITGILMQQVTSNYELTLSELWRLLRLPREEFLALLRDMVLNENQVSGPIISGTAHELMSLMENSEKEFTGILSTAQRFTDIFKSIPLRQSLHSSSFSVNELSEGTTVLYVIIPADKLKTHYAWLRLVVTTAMKAVIREPNKRVIFCLDEAYALGYLPELQIGMGTYAGFNVSIWTFWQSLAQLKQLYTNNWESFMGNSAVKHFFGLNDKTSMEYASSLTGQVSVLSYGRQGDQITPHGSSSRMLLTADEARRIGDAMLVFVENLPVTLLSKLPYYSHPIWKERAQPNPYYLGG